MYVCVPACCWSCERLVEWQQGRLFVKTKGEQHCCIVTLPTWIGTCVFLPRRRALTVNLVRMGKATYRQTGQTGFPLVAEQMDTRNALLYLSFYLTTETNMKLLRLSMQPDRELM